MIVWFFITVTDGAGVAGHGLNVASEYVPDEYGQGIYYTSVLNLYRMQALTYEHKCSLFQCIIYDDNALAAMTTVGNVLVDQSEADGDLSITQRAVLAGGSALEGAADFAGDIQPLADTLTVAGTHATAK